jgi:hypothetical protein
MMRHSTSARQPPTTDLLHPGPTARGANDMASAPVPSAMTRAQVAAGTLLVLGIGVAFVARRRVHPR